MAHSISPDKEECRAIISEHRTLERNDRSDEIISCILPKDEMGKKPEYGCIHHRTQPSRQNKLGKLLDYFNCPSHSLNGSSLAYPLASQTKLREYITISINNIAIPT